LASLDIADVSTMVGEIYKVINKFNMHDVNWTDATVSSLWDYYSNNKSYSDQYFAKQFGAHIVRFAHKHIPTSPHAGVVIDYGCGTGYLIQYLMDQKFERVIGVDFSKQSICEARSQFSKHSTKSPHSIHASCLPTEIENESADVFSIDGNI